VSILTAELYELHDRARVEVYAFSGATRTARRCARAWSAMDHYIRIGKMTDEQAARCIRAHEIDVLIDLHGLTLGARPNILAPAGAAAADLSRLPRPHRLPGVDYVIADGSSCRPSWPPHFTEKPLYMPDTFQINDRQRLIGPRRPARRCGLPEDAFVFCSFNNNFKFTRRCSTPGCASCAACPTACCGWWPTSGCARTCSARPGSRASPANA
jgi:predicted O-linked N-acetylglucosamine transferase (SPINDLY family)